VQGGAVTEYQSIKGVKGSKMNDVKQFDDEAPFLSSGHLFD
jgi:hypothetical protein